MAQAAGIGSLVVDLYFFLLIARLVVELVLGWSRSARPSGVFVIVVEVVYTLTDPPLRLARRFIPPLRLGAVSLDIAFAVVLIAVSMVGTVLTNVAVTGRGFG